MSERYQIIIKAGEHTFHFKTKTRVGEFWNFSEEMKKHVDDLMRQVKAGCIMPQVYVPLQVSHIFKKEDKE